MFIKTHTSIAIALAALGSSALCGDLASAQEEPLTPCKPVDTVENFTLSEFVSAPWYTHQQAENTFAPPNQSCVKAEYKIRESPSVPWGYSVDVYNSGREEDGTFVDANLCAFQEDGDDPVNASKLRVAPCFVPKAASGDFWVVDYDELEGYALIAAGQPTRPGVDGCRTGDSMANSGLWIFTRSPIRDEVLIDSVRTIALDAGYDITVLNDVSQEDCDENQVESGTEAPDEIICQDIETEFPVWPFGSVDCDWVEDLVWLGSCLWHSDKCPEVCGKCD